MTTALNDIRVIDLTSGPAGGMASMILADFGADVLTIERPANENAPGFNELPAAPLWRRGKKLLTLDLKTDDGLNRLQALLAGADVLICNWRQSALVRSGLDYDTMHARHPHLVYCHITGFGASGPLADLPGYEHLIAAATGRMSGFANIVDRDGPVFSALQVGVHACAQSAAAGVMAALFERGHSGAGRCVATSMLQGMLPYEQFGLIANQFEHFRDMFSGMTGETNEPPMPSLYYHPAQAGDGRWMQFGNLLPHLFDNFLIATGLMDVLTDPDWDPEQMILTSPEKHEAFRERMLLRIQERSSGEWMQDLIEDGGVAATIYQTSQEALTDPDIVANGHVIARDDGGRQLGPIARLSQTPAEPGPDAAADTELAELWSKTPRPAPGRDASSDLPLKGVRVIEFATIIAAPLSASFLADMGAEVIKVEQIGGDPFRGLAFGIGSARVNAGKRSISINLKSDEGRSIALDLIAKADILIHNYRPGVPERLGIGYEAASARNPRIVYVQSNGYGPEGRSANRPSTHPIPGAAMGGVMYQMGENLPKELQDVNALRRWTRRLMRANEVNPDPNTALVIATSAMLGLSARERTGAGQQVFVDMFGANAYANADDFLDYPGKPGRAMPDPLMHGLSATYRLYPCADDTWVFLAAVSPAERKALADALAGAAIGGPDAAKINAGDAAADSELSTALASMFAAKDADTWEQLFVPRGVGCVRADGRTPSDFWLQHPQSRDLGLTSGVTHPVWGDYQRHGRLVTFDETPHPLGAPPLAGQHNLEILHEQGMDADTVERLTAAGVLYQEAQA
jgi:crotonobetainyl-CoA:carnitine CoA-transferase CaiB-like acyl-CoA transferase